MKQNIQILVVEDDATDAFLIDRELRKGGLSFRSQRVDSQEGFLAALVRQPPDLILSDHGLPTFDGFSALAIARAKVPDVPFIFVTGSLGEETTIKALKGGAADYILKHRLASLAPAVHRALCQAEERARRREAEAALRRSEEQVLLLNAELEKRVSLRTAELEAANKELEAFSYSVSHDLRAPLRHVEGFIDMLQTQAGPGLNEECLGFVNTIARSARQMNQLIDDLLAFSRTGRTEMFDIAVDMAALIETARRDLASEMAGRKIVWSIGPMPGIIGDPATLRQVVLNLVSNALKYSRPRVETRIEIGAAESALETIFYVRDNGVGFNPQYVGKLFNVFQRLHSAAEFEGTGIGLAIVQRIIARHGGRTWAEGRMDEGASFYFTIPKNPLARG